MTVVVTHTTPADSTFSSTGAAAWNANHALSGVGTMAEQDANNVAITGGSINNATVGATTASTGAFTTLSATSLDNTVIGGTTPAAGTFTTLTATGQTSLGGAAGSEGLRVVTSAGSNDWIQVNGSNFGRPLLRAASASGNPSLGLSSQGTGVIQFYTNTSAQEQMRISHTASAVNYVQVTGAATGSAPTISAQGSDSNIDFSIATKGTGAFNFFTRSTARQFEITNTASSVNWLRANGSATGQGVQFSAQGSDTNIAQVFQPKGTGAIDLAAGSSGVNISNGGTVTAITKTADGTLYTTLPTISVSAPTTAGGVQATLQLQMYFTPTTIVSGGTGYTVGDVLTLVGGTPVTTASSITVTAVSGGVITGAARTNFNSYTVLPTNPVSVTGGTGSGATFNLTWAVGAIVITNAGSGYVEQPTVSFSGGGGSGATAYATVGGNTSVTGLGSNINFFTAGGYQQFQISNNSGATTGYFSINGASQSGQLFSVGTANAVIGTSSTGAMRFTTSYTLEQMRVSHTASAVNYVQVTGAATGGNVAITSQGSDANIGLDITAKGGGFVRTGGWLRVGISSANYLQLASSSTGFGPVISSVGSDTDIPLVLQPKGTGALQAQQTDSTVTGGNARGANAVDWSTARATAAQVASGQWSTISGGVSNTVSATASNIGGGATNAVSNTYSGIFGGQNNTNTATYSFIGGGSSNTTGTNAYQNIVGGKSNTASGFFNFIGGGFTNNGTSAGAVTTQSGTMNATTAVTLSGSNANIKVGQYILGTSIAADTYVAAISGTSLTLSQAASGSSTSTLSFYTPHGVVVGGGNNQATGSYSFIGGGGDAGTAANRNVASGDWSVVVGGSKNTASGIGSFIGGGGTYGFVSGNTASGASSAIAGGLNNTSSGFASFVGGGNTNIASGQYSSIMGGAFGTTRGIYSNNTFSSNTITGTAGVSQAALLILGKETTNATATVITSDGSAASSTNQVILPNNSAYFFTGEVVAGVTGGGNTKGWTIEGVIKRGAGVGTTTLVGSTVTSMYADVGAATWTIGLTADTTNGGLAVTFTGQASTTIRTVCQIRTTEVTY